MKRQSEDYLFIDGETLSIDNVIDVAFHQRKVSVKESAKEKIHASRKYVERLAESDTPIYGVNTGFGALAETKVKKEDIRQLQINLIRSHSVGIGKPLPIETVRAMMLLRANVLAKGYSGCRMVVIERLLEMLNKNITPVIPEKGSVGASGDLAPLAHLALALIGEGSVYSDDNTIISSDVALKKAKISPLILEAKEGLSLINGTQAMSAMACIAANKITLLLKLADIAGACSIEGIKGSKTPFRENIQLLRDIQGQKDCAENLSRLLDDSEIMFSHSHCSKVQDPYSFRCMPQVHGAARETFLQFQRIVTAEINAGTDNPLVFVETKEILSGGNFHGQLIALWLDFISIAVAELANISERRIEHLLNPALSGLPPFLTKHSGLNSGLMIVQVAAASLVNENKVLCHPASSDSIPSSANKEDHVSMGMTSARKLFTILENVETVLAMELLCSSQALTFLEPLHPAKAVKKAYETIRKEVSFIEEDRILYKDIEKIRIILPTICEKVEKEILRSGGLK